MKKQNMDVVVIGGSAAGLVAAITAKSNYPDKNVMVIRQEEKVMIPCGIPYIFGTLGSSESNVLPDGGLINAGVNIKVDTVTDINIENHLLETKDGSLITYEKLIIATGSQPYIPSFISGTNLENVFTVPKDKEYLDRFLHKLKGLNKVAVIGAGFIGVELSDELNKIGKDVSIIEFKPHILGAAFDEDTSLIAESLLKDRGVSIFTSKEVVAIKGANKVDSISFSNGETMNVDAVVLAIGYTPNIELAKRAGVSCNKQGSIKVDAYMRTHQKDVFSCGIVPKKETLSLIKSQTLC